MSTVSAATPGLKYDLMWVLKPIGMKALCTGVSLLFSVPLCQCLLSVPFFSHSHETVHVLHGSSLWIPKSFGSVSPHGHLVGV